MIAITGATGVTGSQVVRALLAQGEQVRLVVRDEGKARSLFGDGVELAAGDYGDPEALPAAIEGASTLFLSGADDRRRVAWECAAIDAAAALGIRRIVKLSAIGAAKGSPVAFWDWHGRIEEHLLWSGVPAVVLRPSFSMANLLAAAGQVASWGRLFAPAGDARISMIDPRDVGAAAAAVLAGAGRDGEILVLTGPEAVTYGDVAADLSIETGRRVEFAHLPDDAALHGLIEAGLPPFAAEQIVAIFAEARRGAAARITPTVAQLTGRPPCDLASFLHEHRQAFSPAASRLAS